MSEEQERRELERRVTVLEKDRTELYSKVNELCTKVAILITQRENAPTMPCIEHRDRMERIERESRERDEKALDRIALIEKKQDRSSGMADLAKFSLGALIPFAVLLIRHWLQ